MVSEELNENIENYDISDQCVSGFMFLVNIFLPWVLYK